jgi:tetratricopeptide (TPR) repeat protein
MRALALLEHGLEQNPHHIELLSTKVLLAEKMGELEKAVDALKLVVHLQLESEDKDAARATLDRLKKLAETDPYAWEKSFDLACDERRDKDAVKDSRALLEIYGKSAQHRKVVSVLERVSRISGSTWEHVRELARARAAAGDRDAAVKGLERFAAELIALESYPLACNAYEEVIAIHPTRARAKATLEELRSGALMQRRARWRRVRRRALAAFLLVVVLPWTTFEVLARRAYLRVTREVVREKLLESGRYDEVRGRYQALSGTYGWTTTGRWDVAVMIEELDALVGAHGTSAQSDPGPTRRDGMEP